MKLYKYITLALAAVVALASCQKEVGDGLSDQNKGKAKPEAAVTIVSAVDDTLTFSVTATGAEVSQFGWVVLEGTDNEVPASLDIVIDEVSGAYASGVFDAAEGMTGTASVEVEPYGEYQIFAVAITKTGLLGEVASINTKITDSTAPEFINWGSDVADDQMLIGLLFDEPVELTGKGEAKLYFAAINDPYDDEGVIAPRSSMDVPADNISVVDGAVYIAVPAECYYPGKYVMLTFSEGFVKNADGVVNAEGWDYYCLTPDGLDSDTVGEQYANEEFSLCAGVAGETFAADPEAEYVFPSNDFPSWDYVYVEIGCEAFDAENPFEYYDEDVAVSFTYKQPSGRTVTVESEPYYSFGEAENGLCYIGITLPEEPGEEGTDISVAIPAGVVEDVWGNTNAAYSAENLISNLVLTEIGTGIFSEPAFLEIETEAKLIYNPVTELYTIQNCFDDGYGLSFTWDRETNKCQIDGLQATNWQYSQGVWIYACDAYEYYGGQYSWEFLEENGLMQPYYEDGKFVFPNVAYILSDNRATNPQFTITFDLGRDITQFSFEGIWTCQSVTDLWGYTYGPFSIAIEQAYYTDGTIAESMYAVSNLSPRLATMGVTSLTFGKLYADENLFVISFGQGTSITNGAEGELYFEGYDSADPGTATSYDDVYFSIDPIAGTIVNLNAYDIATDASYFERYYGGAMQLKYAGPLPATSAAKLTSSQAKSDFTASAKAEKAKSLEYRKEGFRTRGMEAFFMPATKVRKLK